MRRSKLLAAVALLLTLALAGCSAPGSISMEQMTDAEIGHEATIDVPDPDPSVDDRGQADARAIREAVENGSSTIDGLSPPIRESGPWGHDDGVYELSYEAIDSHEETAADVEIDFNPEDTSGTAIAYEDLPSVDKRRLDRALEHDDRQSEGYDFGIGTRYNDSEAAKSVLVGGQDYDIIVYEGERYRIAIETESVTVNTYRYTANQIAPSVSAYGTQLREDREFVLDGLDDQERSVIQDAIEGRYTADGDDDDAFEAVLAEFRSHEAVEEDEYEGTWIARYEGDTYWVRLRYGAYAAN